MRQVVRKSVKVGQSKTISTHITASVSTQARAEKTTVAANRESRISSRNFPLLAQLYPLKTGARVIYAASQGEQARQDEASRHYAALRTYAFPRFISSNASGDETQAETQCFVVQAEMPKVILESKKEGQKTFTIFSLVTALLLASSVESEICPVEPQGSARGSSLLCEQRNEEKEGTPPKKKVPRLQPRCGLCMIRMAASRLVAQVSCAPIPLRYCMCHCTYILSYSRISSWLPQINTEEELPSNNAQNAFRSNH